MKPYWRLHRRVLLGLLGSWILVLLIDLVVLRPTTSGWVPIDLRGNLIVPWVLCTSAFAVVTTALVAWRRPDPGEGAVIYASATLALAISLVLAYGWWARVDEQKQERIEALARAESRLVAEALRLSEWRVTENSVVLLLELDAPLDELQVITRADVAEPFASASGATRLQGLGAGSIEIRVPVEWSGSVAPEDWRIELELRRLGAGVVIEYVRGAREAVEGTLVVRDLPRPSPLERNEGPILQHP